MKTIFLKSKGLNAKLIEMTKFDITFFRGPLEIQAKLIIPRIFKSLQKTKMLYKKEVNNPPQDVKIASQEFWASVIEKSKSLGIDLIGFTPVDEAFIFQKDHTGDIENLYKNGIVLGMEMDYSAIDVAPEPPAGLEALKIYADLGEATNELTRFIQKKGYNAIACHPLGGPILYPAMAVKAGLGQIGKQGLLITKEFGPRQRLAMITINAEPLPKNHYDSIEISDYCNKCRRCIRMCPVEAIYDEPLTREDGNISRIDGEKCIVYFYKTTGCSVCIKECPFHKIGYKVMFYSRL